jgi:hypothetical protein
MSFRKKKKIELCSFELLSKNLVGKIWWLEIFKYLLRKLEKMLTPPNKNLLPWS